MRAKKFDKVKNCLKERTKMSINNVVISGHVCADPDVKEFSDGGCIVSFTVGVKERRKSKEGEWVDFTQFIDVKARGGIAKLARQTLCKGTHVTVGGRLVKEEWTDKQSGQKRNRVLVDMVELDWNGGRTREENQERRETRREDRREYQRDERPKKERRNESRYDDDYYPEYQDF